MHALRKFSRSLVYQSIVAPLLVLYAAGHMFDVLTTFVALEFYGGREQNPFLAWLLNSKIPGKWLAVSGLKIWHVNGVHHFMDYTNIHSLDRYTLRTLAFMNVFMWAVVTWNFSVILRRKYGTRS